MWRNDRAIAPPRVLLSPQQPAGERRRHQRQQPERAQKMEVAKEFAHTAASRGAAAPMRRPRHAPRALLARGYINATTVANPRGQWNRSRRGRCEIVSTWRVSIWSSVP